MTYFAEHATLLIAGKQAAFGAAATEGKIVPIVKGGQGPTHDRNKIDNDGRYQDGFKREFALGNHKAGVDAQLVPNLDYLGDPLIGFLGGFTDSGAGPLYTHAGKPTKNVIYHTFEESYAGLAAAFYQYLDQVYSEYNFELDTEGLFKPSFKTMGSGNLVKAAATFDATPTEVAGAPVELITWVSLINGLDEGIITKLSANCKREVIEVRPSGGTGKCTALIVGGTEITGTLTCLFKDDVQWNRARSGTLMAVKATITQLVGANTYSLEHLFPELKLVPSSPKKQSGQAIQQDFTFEAILKADADSPMKVTLINGVASHNA